MYSNAVLIADVLQDDWEGPHDIFMDPKDQMQAASGCGAWRELVETMDKKMVFTVTLIASRELALQTFARLNCTGRPLGAVDVLKAHLMALPQGTSSRRELAQHQLQLFKE